VSAALVNPELVPVGAVKTFGAYGPMYEVLGPAPRGVKGEMVHIRVFFTDEELDYPVADMLSDPLKP
jgi:hypothetical protein